MKCSQAIDARVGRPADASPSATTTGFKQYPDTQIFRRQFTQVAPVRPNTPPSAEPRRAVWSTDVATGLCFRQSVQESPDGTWLPNPGLTQALEAPRALRGTLTLCPIAHEAIEVPVQLATPVLNERLGPYWQGASYEKSQLCSWLAFSSTSPLTGEKLLGEARVVVNLGLSDCLRLSRGEPVWDLRRKEVEVAYCRAWRVFSERSADAGLQAEEADAEALPGADDNPDLVTYSGLWGGQEVSAKNLLMHVVVGVVLALSFAQGHEKWSLVTDHLAVRLF